MAIRMSRRYQQYAQMIKSELHRLHETATNARKIGLDPAKEPESKIARDLAELVEGLVGPKGVADSIRELSQRLPREQVAFKIAEEIAYGKFGHMETETAVEQAVRTSLGILTEGITAAPLQGVAKVEIKANFDATKYLAIYFAGPIRSAGGTDQVLTLVIGDFVRRLLGLSRYKPTEEEVNRFIEEIRLYERRVGRFQYHVTDAQLKLAIESIPVEVSGTKSDPVEVQAFRNLPRIETNHIRGGALRVVNDGVIGRAAKVYTIIEKLDIEGWDWLKHIGEAEDVVGYEKAVGFMEDIIAGRPIFAFPSHPSGFRLRYGRARNTGLAAVGVHPLTMAVLDNFLAGGTQMRIELPGKGGIVLPVDSIEPPIVLLENGTVTRVSEHNFPHIKSKIQKILFLGDLLVSFGDFLYNNTKLRPSGYTEEWWIQELKSSIDQLFNGNIDKASTATKLSVAHIRELISNPMCNPPNPYEAITLAKNLGIPLHPKYTHFWSRITIKELQELRQWIHSSQVSKATLKILSITGKLNKTIKKILENLCVAHRVVENKILIEAEEAVALATCLGSEPPSEISNSSTLEAIYDLSGIIVRAKAPTTIGARMGRPEKAKMREMKHVNVLFPIGLAGGSRRNLMVAVEKGPINVELVKRRCPSCGEHTTYVVCPTCETETTLEMLCPRCGRNIQGELCSVCSVNAISYERRRINLKTMMNTACRRLQVIKPKIVVGVKGLSNERKIAEILDKGILRAKEKLSVYKDGTTRFDATNAPLSHFKPCEVKVSTEKLKQLGYLTDRDGKPLIKAEQICELKVQDVVIPLRSASFFVRVANFIDQLLEKIYNVPRYYNLKHRDDLVGHLLIGLAPHTSVGILGRIVGFTDLNVCYAHPLWHSAKRRDCDGDEDALILALDVLLNFSKAYLPDQIGGIMDAPLFVIPTVNPTEVQRQAHEFDVTSHYPLDFYRKTMEEIDPNRTTSLIRLVAQKLETEGQFEGFDYTTPVSNINMGNRKSMYRKLKKMTDKLNSQLKLAEKIEAVNAKEVALKVLTTHFLRDISGNLRAFTTQSFRCKSCNKRFRRLPLKGSCSECGGPLSLTVYRGGIEKYVSAARLLVKKYQLSDYYLDRLTLITEEIQTLFEGIRPLQVKLIDFA